MPLLLSQVATPPVDLPVILLWGRRRQQQQRQGGSSGSPSTVSPPGGCLEALVGMCARCGGGGVSCSAKCMM